MSADLEVKQRGQSLDRELEKAQAALLARFAPDTRVRRIRWSQGETQVFELGSGAPAALRPRWVGRRIRGGADPRGARARTTACSRSIGRVTGWPIRSTTAASICSTTLGRSCATSWMRSSSRPSTWSPTRWARSGPSPSRSTLPAASRASRSSARRSGSSVRCRCQMLPLGLPLIGQRLGRHVFSNATRDGSRKFWGQVLVEHPERARRSAARRRRRARATKRREHARLGAVHRRCPTPWAIDAELILGERWRALTTPTLLVWGDRDAFGSPEEGEALVAKNPNLRLVRVAGAGHLPWFDDPERVVAEIEHFLATEPPSRVEAAAPSRPPATSPAAKANAQA